MSNFNLHKALNKYSLFFLMFISVQTFSQVGIINDPDGFTNVRKDSNSNSEIIHIIHDNEMFIYFSNYNENGWIQVHIPKNRFLDNPYYDNYNSYLVGYIHKSRLKDISALDSLSNQDFRFDYNLKNFNKENKIIDYYNSDSSSYIIRINGQYVYGQDGAFPKIETNSIDVVLNGKKIEIPKVLFQNLFECTGKLNITEQRDCYYVSQMNSDGAGAYMVVWAINKTGLIQRIIFIP